MKYLEHFNQFEALTESKKYEHINFIPPKTVSNQVKKGLMYKKKANEQSKYKIKYNAPRAHSLKNRDKISPVIIKRMCSFFNRFRSREVLEKYKKEPWKDKKYVTHLLWGGDSGRSWSEKVRTQLAKADKK